MVSHAVAVMYNANDDPMKLPMTGLYIVAISTPVAVRVIIDTKNRLPHPPCRFDPFGFAIAAKPDTRLR